MAYAKLCRYCQWQISYLKLAVICLLLCSFVQAQTQSTPLNLNTATAAQLETLPGIGPGLANRILEYRRKHGPFKRPQDLLIVRGMSAKRFRQLAAQVRVSP
jgi:competence ComEA-like helix-hairpin-helix protein